MGTEDKDVSQPAFSWKDHKTGGVAAAIMLIASALSAGGFHVVTGKAADPGYVTKSALENSLSLLEQKANGMHQAMHIEFRDRIDNRVSAEMSAVREELRRNQIRLDELLERTARMSAILDGRQQTTR
jgi:hypothetical protein